MDPSRIHCLSEPWVLDRDEEAQRRLSADVQAEKPDEFRSVSSDSVRHVQSRALKHRREISPSSSFPRRLLLCFTSWGWSRTFCMKSLQSNMASSWSARSSNMLPMSSRIVLAAFTVFDPLQRDMTHNQYQYTETPYHRSFIDSLEKRVHSGQI